MATPKAKIMVNWQKQKIVHTMDPVGSDNYRTLLKDGYVEVGEVKNVDTNQIFWNSHYFCPQDKYLRGGGTDTIHASYGNKT